MKKNILNRIIIEKVLTGLQGNFNDLGFNLKKGIKGFTLKKDDLLHKFYISDQRYEIFTDKNYKDPYLYLSFDSFFETKIPEFEKWYINNFGRGDHTRISTFRKHLKFCLPLIENEDFQIPKDFSPNQQTIITERRHLIKKKEGNVYVFSDVGDILEIDDFESHKNKIFYVINEQIEKTYNYENMAIQNYSWFKYQALLIFKNKLDIPKKYVNDRYNFLISEFNTEQDSSKKQKILNSLDRLIEIGNTYLDLSITNPNKN